MENKQTNNFNYSTTALTHCTSTSTSVCVCNLLDFIHGNGTFHVYHVYLIVAIVVYHCRCLQFRIVYAAHCSEEQSRTNTAYIIILNNQFKMSPLKWHQQQSEKFAAAAVVCFFLAHTNLMQCLMRWRKLTKRIKWRMTVEKQIWKVKVHTFCILHFAFLSLSVVTIVVIVPIH